MTQPKKGVGRDKVQDWAPATLGSVGKTQGDEVTEEGYPSEGPGG